MSSSHSSEDSQSDGEVGNGQRKRLNSTPLTPIFPEDACSGNEATRTGRSSSFVRFQNLNVVANEEATSSPRRAPRSPMVSPTSYDDLTERVDSLQNQLQNLELSRNPESSEKGDESSEMTGLSTEIQWMSWQEYLEDASKATHILEVLTEKPHTNSRRKSFAPHSNTIDVPQRTSTKTPPSQYKNIERIRIRSFHIVNALQAITEQSFSNPSRLIIHRPFKVLLFYQDQIADYLVELERDFAENTQCSLGEQCKGFVQLSKGRVGSQLSSRRRSGSVREDSSREPTKEFSDNALALISDGNACRHEYSEELEAQLEAITHLRILVNFMNDDMKEVFAKHELLRSSEAEKVAFIDMWHLFMAGDLIVAESDSSEKGFELYQVSVLPACDFFSSRRPVKQIQTRTEGSHQLVESVYKEEAVSAMSVFTVDVFYFDFDGQKFGKRTAEHLYLLRGSLNSSTYSRLFEKAILTLHSAQAPSRNVLNWFPTKAKRTLQTFSSILFASAKTATNSKLPCLSEA